MGSKSKLSSTLTMAVFAMPSNVDPAGGALEELQRVIGVIRKRWAQTRILVRGDSAYAREDIMVWCEAQTGVDYVFGLASNARKRAHESAHTTQSLGGL